MKLITSILTSLAIATCASFAADNDTIKIKGIYIGMPMEEALEACKKMVQGTPVESWAKYMEISKSKKDDSQMFSADMTEIIAISAKNNNGKLTYFKMNAFATNKIFKCADMGSPEFTKMFMDAYKIPDMNLDETGENYEYKTDDGTKVTVGRDKSFTLEKVQTKEEAKSAFD